VEKIFLQKIDNQFFAIQKYSFFTTLSIHSYCKDSVKFIKNGKMYIFFPNPTNILSLNETLNMFKILCQEQNIVRKVSKIHSECLCTQYLAQQNFIPLLSVNNVIWFTKSCYTYRNYYFCRI